MFFVHFSCSEFKELAFSPKEFQATRSWTRKAMVGWGKGRMDMGEHHGDKGINE